MRTVRWEVLGGKEYRVFGSVTEREFSKIVEVRYSTPEGEVTVKNGTVHHPDGSESALTEDY